MGYQRRGSRTVYENRWLRFEAHDIVHPNGTPGEHGLVVTPPSVGIVILDGDTLLLARQERFAIGAPALEIVKGGTGPDESYLAAAEREVREEVGVHAASWDELGIAHEIPSIVFGPVRLYLARDLTVVATDPEDVESVVTVRMPFVAALEAVLEGDIDDAVTALALMRTARRLGGLRI